jgi:signal transduction histidine kinase
MIMEPAIHDLTRELDVPARPPVPVAEPVDLDVELEERPPRDTEATAYYIAAEALTNVARHAEATGARVTLRRDGAVLRVEIADDGKGGADASAGTGLVGLRDRAEAAGGTLGIASPPGAGTVIVASLPL